MAQPERQLEFDTWHVPGRTPLVAYARLLMDRIVEDANLAFTRGRGADSVGGILFGSADDEEVRITAYRPVPKRARSEDFTLTEEDETILQHMLQTSNSDTELRKLVPVGWYHSRTAGDIAMSPGAVDLWNRQFPFRWQVALVLKPQAEGPTRAGFFFRPAKGNPQTDHSMREFELVPLAARVEDDLLEDPPPPPPAELFSFPPARGRSRAIWLWSVPVVLTAFGAGWAGWYWGRKPVVEEPQSRHVSAGLRATEKDGFLNVSWNPASPVFQSGPARLDILDGERRSVLPLTPAVRAAGSWTVIRTTDEVRIILRTGDEGRGAARESMRFIAPREKPDAALPATLARTPSAAQPQAELLKLQEALRRVTTANETRRTRLEELQRIINLRNTPAAKAEPKPEPPAPAAPEPPKPAAVAAVKPEPPPEPVTLPPPPKPEPPRYSGPRSGRMIWTGYLPPNTVLSIDGRRASIGTVNAVLPSVAARVAAYPAEITSGGLSIYTASPGRGAEARSAQTGWMDATFVQDAARAREVQVAAQPAGDAPQRIQLRSGDRPVSAILIEWQVPPQ
ncbi:MAG: hypothetical protein FJW39_00580 [Acidobacteria bacterium]|nr:hypothetical protein [Acidobacteriota bacterium]